MAVVLSKIANAENARARQRPSGLTGILADGVALIRRATSPTQSCALPAKIPVSQRPQGLDQRFPSALPQVDASYVLRLHCIRIDEGAFIQRYYFSSCGNCVGCFCVLVVTLS